MAVKTYKITGVFRQNRKKHVFNLDARALNEESAKETVFKNFGSKHKLKKRDITIENVTEIESKDSKSLVIQQIGGE